MAVSSSEVLLVPKGAKSPFWKYFGFTVDQEGKIVDNKVVWCRECWKSIAYSGNTTNLKQHLQNNHPAVLTGLFGECSTSQSQQLTLESTGFSPKSKMPHGSKHAREITDKLVRFIMRDIRPLSVIEGKGFLEFVDVLNPQY